MTFGHWIVSPRMPFSFTAWLTVSAVVVAMLFLTPMFVLQLFRVIVLFCGFPATLTHYAGALVLSVAIHAAFFARVVGFSVWNGLEIGLSTAFFSLTFAYGLEVWAPAILVLSVLTALRPLTDGPEPGGWEAQFRALEEKTNRKKQLSKLKGRRDKSQE